MPHSLISCGKWWHARYCIPPNYQSVRCHWLWYYGLISPTNNIPILDHVKISNLSERIENSEIGIGFKTSPWN
jgi:hypothetical protein